MIETSSLHGLVIGALLGIPTALVQPAKESPFKYKDYVLGTGRTEYIRYSDLTAATRALNKRGIEFTSPVAAWEPGPLENAFPLDLWGG